MKGFMRGLLNVFWVIFVGLWSAISSILTGIASCLTIIGIPFGLQHFKFVKLVFAPAGKVVATKYSRHPVMNTIWLLFGGLVSSILYLLLSGVFFITIIGIPLAKQLFKIASFNFAPFGCEVVLDGEYTTKQDTAYDAGLVMKRIDANPDMVVGTDLAGSPLTAWEYIGQRVDYEKIKGMAKKQAEEVRREKSKGFLERVGGEAVGHVVAYIGCFVLMIVVASMATWLTMWGTIALFVALFIIFMVGYFVLENTKKIKTFTPLCPYYPKGSPEGKASLTYLGLLQKLALHAEAKQQEAASKAEEGQNQPPFDSFE